MRPLAGRALAVALLALTGVASPMGAASAGTQPLRVAATPATHAPTLAATPQAPRLAAEPRPAAKSRPAAKRRPRPHGLGARRPATRLAAARTPPPGPAPAAPPPAAPGLSPGTPAP